MKSKSSSNVIYVQFTDKPILNDYDYNEVFEAERLYNNAKDWFNSYCHILIDRIFKANESGNKEAAEKYENALEVVKHEFNQGMDDEEFLKNIIKTYPDRIEQLSKYNIF